MWTQRVRELTPSATLAMNAKRQELQAEGRDVINFSVGEPDFDTPEYVREAAKRALDEGWTRYTPVAGVPELRQCIADLVSGTRGVPVGAAQVLVTSGAKQALAEVLLTQVDRGDEVLVPAPYWVSYPEMVRVCEGIPVSVPSPASRGYKITPRDLEKSISPRTVGLILNSPNNPTGAVYSADEIAEILSVAERHDLWILSDEIYEHFTYDCEFASAFVPGHEARTTLVGGMSKSYAMTGWRIGWAVASEELIATAARLQGHLASNAAAVSQAAALAALRGPDGGFMESMIAEYRARRDLALAELRSVPTVEVHPPAGAFYIYLDISGLLRADRTPHTDTEFCLAGLEAGFALVPGEAFGAPGTVRLSFSASQEQIREGIGRLRGFVEELGANSS